MRHLQRAVRVAPPVIRLRATPAAVCASRHYPAKLQLAILRSADNGSMVIRQSLSHRNPRHRTNCVTHCVTQKPNAKRIVFAMFPIPEKPPMQESSVSCFFAKKLDARVRILRTANVQRSTLCVVSWRHPTSLLPISAPQYLYSIVGRRSNLRKRFWLLQQCQGVGERDQCNLVEAASVQHGKAFGIQTVWHL